MPVGRSRRGRLAEQPEVDDEPGGKSTALVGPHVRPPSAAALRLPLVGAPGYTVAVLLAFLTPVAPLVACGDRKLLSGMGLVTT